MEKKISPFPHLDKAMETLTANKKKWVNLSLETKIKYLENVRKTLALIVDEWTKCAVRFKGIDPELPENSSLLALDYLNITPLGAYINNQIDILKRSKDLGNGAIELPKPKIEENKIGVQYTRVFPQTTADNMLQPGLTIDIWLAKDKPITQGASLREEKEGRVCVILGGGNVNVIPAADALHKLFVENQVVMMKYNPANASTGFWIDKLFAELIRDGFYASAGGETEPGVYLVEHKLADTLHMTGSDATYDRIVWGHPNEQKDRKSSGKKCNSKYFSCELGCVSPWMLCPGSWTDKSLRHQAKQLANAMTFNNGFVCASPKVAVMSKGWEHKDTFLGYLQDELKKIPSRPGYYKGAHFRHRTFIEKYKEKAIIIKPKNFKDDHLEWVIIPDMQPNADEYAFKTESFSPLICIVEVDNAKDASSYLKNVPEFCNKNIWGSLSCTLIIPDEERKAYEKELDEAIQELGYGTVGINAWAVNAYGKALWGGFPGTGKAEDIQSGIDFVFNPYMFDHPSKSVAKSPIISDAHGVKDLGGAQLKAMSRVARYYVSPTTVNFTKVVSGAIAGL